MRIDNIKFLKKLIPALLLISISLYLTNSFLSKNKVISTASKTIIEQTVKNDLNGDGKDDSLYIALKENKDYYMYATINNKDYVLKPSDKIKSIGRYSPNHPMTLNLIDIDRNNIPEIIIQSSEDKTSIQHIFKWTGANFENIYSSTNNLLGLVDSNNGKTPKIISFSLNSSKYDIQKYMLLNNNLKNISYDNLDVPGFNSICEFINIVSLGYDLSELPNIFVSYISSEDLSQLWRLDKDNFYYVFQDAFFRDTNWNEFGELTSCDWNVRFNKVSKIDENKTNQISFSITIEKVQDNFLISSFEAHLNKN